MDNPVDNIVDLGLINYVKHPTNPNYIVFRLPDPDRAESFEKALKEDDIWFEKGSEDKRTRTFYLFGVHKNDFKRVEKINFLVEAEHKKPFIPFKIFRYFLILMSITVMTLAVLGYCERQKKLRLIEETSSSINNTELSQ